MKRATYMFGMLALFGIVFAAAAVLNVQDSVLQAGEDDVLACDHNGVFVDGWGYENDTLTVSYVRIGGINAIGCDGKEMHVDVYGADNVTSLGGDDWVISGGANPVTHTFNFASPVSAALTESIHIGISD